MMQSIQVIIERLETHPEDFFGDLEHSGRAPRFEDIVQKIDDLLLEKKDMGHAHHRLWFLTPEEKAALIEAYTNARRARFETKVFHQLLAKQDEVNTVTYKAQGRYVLGVDKPIDPRALYGKPIVDMVEQSRIEAREKEYQALKQKHGASN